MNSSTIKSFENFPFSGYNYKLIYFMPSKQKTIFYSFVLPFSFLADLFMFIPRKLASWFSRPNQNKNKYKLV